MSSEQNNENMDKQVSIKTLLAFVAAIGIPVLVFMYTLSIKADRNEDRSMENKDYIRQLISADKDARRENNRNFDKVLDKLHEIDLKLKDKANRK